jgi:signal transduction histidine kinase
MWGRSPTDLMNEDLLVDARIRALSRLSGATMHELRGAANSVALHLQLLALEPHDDDDVERRRRSLAAVDDGRRRLFDIAEVFVRHTVLPDLRPSEFDLARLTGDAVALSRPYAVQRRVDMTLAPTRLAPAVRGRRDVVSQVLLDLLLDMLDRAGNGGSVDVAVESENGAGAVHAALRVVSPDRPPDVERVAGAEAAMQWAGGELRHDGDRLVLRLPVPPPGESQ